MWVFPLALGGVLGFLGGFFTGGVLVNKALLKAQSEPTGAPAVSGYLPSFTSRRPRGYYGRYDHAGNYRRG